MGTVMAVRPWMVDRDGSSADCVKAAERSQSIGAHLVSLESEERELLVELNGPSFRQKRHAAGGEAIADGREPDDVVPDVRGRLKEIAEEKPPLNAALTVLGERYSRALREAKAELSRELRPKYAALLKPMVSAVVDLLVAAQAEAEFRLPLRMQDISFSGGLLQGLPLAGAQPDGSIVLWLRKINQFYPELKVEKLAAKNGVEI